MDLGTLIARIGVDTRSLKRNLGGAKRQFSSFSRHAQRHTRKVSTAFKKMAAGLVAVKGAIAGVVGKLGTLGLVIGAAGIGLGIASATKSFASFEKEMGKVANLVDSMEDKKFVMGPLSDSIKAMAVEFGIAREEIALASFDILSAGAAGVKTAKFMDLLRTSAKLTKANFSSMAITTKALITAVQIYGKTLKGAGEAAAIMFQITKFGRVNMDEFAKVFGRFAVIAKNLNVTMMDMGGLFAALTLTGVPIEQTATQMKAFFEVFTKPKSAGALELMEKFGIDMGVAAMKGENLRKTIEGMSKLTLPELRVLLPESEAFAAGLAFSKDIETTIRLLKEVNKLMDAGVSFQDATNFALGLTDTKLTQLAERWRTLKERAAPAGLLIVNFLIDIANRIGAIITSLKIMYAQLRLGSLELAKLVTENKTVSIAVDWITLGMGKKAIDWLYGTKEERAAIDAEILKEREALVRSLDKQQAAIHGTTPKFEIADKKNAEALAAAKRLREQGIDADLWAQQLKVAAGQKIEAEARAKRLELEKQHVADLNALFHGIDPVAAMAKVQGIGKDATAGAKDLIKAFNQLEHMKLEMEIGIDEAALLRDIEKAKDQVMALINFLRKQGVKISVELETKLMAHQTKKVTDRLTEISDAGKESMEELNEFAVQAARNMETAFSDFFFNVMDGNFDSLSDTVRDFERTIMRMIANIVAKDLASALFGKDFGSQGQMGGIFGSLFGMLGGGNILGIGGGAGGGGGGGGGFKIWDFDTDLPTAHQGGVTTKEMLARVDKDEAIVPLNRIGQFMNKIQDGAGSGARQQPTIINNNVGPINAMDSRSFRQFSMENADVFMDVQRRARKDNYQTAR